MKKLLALLLFGLLWHTAPAHAQCAPNPNANGIVTNPYVDNCTLPSQGLNQSFSAVIRVPNNTALAALQRTGTFLPTYVTRAGFATPGDGGEMNYHWSNLACTLNAGAGDAGSQVPANGGGCWLWDPLPTVPLEVFGGVGDGSTDNSAKFTTAFASGATNITLFGKTYSSTTAVTVPDGIIFGGNSTDQGQASPVKSTISCTVAVTNDCLVVGAADNKPDTVHDLHITFGAGTLSGTAECAKVNGGQNVLMKDVSCSNANNGFQTLATGANGIYVRWVRPQTCNITGKHFRGVSLPGVYVENGIFGCNTGDVNGTAFISFEGNWDNTQGTVHFVDTQLNLGASKTVTCGISFNNFTGTTNIIKDIEFIGGHMETAQTALCSDATVAGIQYFHVGGSWWAGGWGGANALFGLNVATKPFQWQLTGDSFTGWTTAALAPSGGYDELKILGSSFANTPLSITGTGASTTLDLADNGYNGLTLAGSFSAGSKVSGIARFGGGTYSYATMTGPVEIDIPGESDIPCSMSLSFSGGNGTLTQTLDMCNWHLSGSQVTVNFALHGNIGTASGFASMPGLPLATNANNLSLSPCWYTGMGSMLSGSNTGFFAQPAPNSTNVTLTSMANTATSQLSAGNFTSAYQFGCSVTYPLSS